MSWVQLDDLFHANPKLEAAGFAATGLYARALSYCGCYLTDGFVPASWSVVQNAPAQLKRTLTQKGLWKRVRGAEVLNVDSTEGLLKVVIPGAGFYIPDYLKFNPSKARVEAERERKRQAGKKGAEARWINGTSHSNRNASSSGGRDAPQPQPLGKEFLTPTLASFEGEDHQSAERRLIAACGGGQAATEKIHRTIVANKLAEGDVFSVLELVQLPDTEDPLARALKALKKRGDERKRRQHDHPF